jgi:hypothetical protein
MSFFTHLSRFIRFDTVRAEDANAVFDEVAAGFSGVETKTDAAIKGPDGESNSAIPAASARKGKVLTFNATTGAPETPYTIADVATVSGIAADVAAVASNASNITTVAGNNANITAVAGNNANVTAVAGNNANITAVAGVASDVTAVASQLIGWNFSATTTMADPGSGAMRFNNATLASVTAIALDDLNSASQDVSAFVATWDDSTSANKGMLTIRQGASFAVFAVSGLTDNAGWTELAVSYVAGSGAFSNATLAFVSFARTGNTGTGITPQTTGFTATGGTTPKTLTVDEDLTASSLAQRGKQTIWIPAGAMKARTTSGAASGTVETTTNKVMLQTLDFDAAAAEYAQFAIRMPKGWNESAVTAYLLWSSAISGTNAVVWGLQAVALSDDDALDAAFGTAQTVTDAQTAQGDLMQTAETSAITIAGTPAAGDWVVFQVYRDAVNGSDTLAGDARLHGVVVIYTTDAANDA